MAIHVAMRVTRMPPALPSGATARQAYHQVLPCVSGLGFRVEIEVHGPEETTPDAEVFLGAYSGVHRRDQVAGVVGQARVGELPPLRPEERLAGALGLGGVEHEPLAREGHAECLTLGAGAP